MIIPLDCYVIFCFKWVDTKIRSGRKNLSFMTEYDSVLVKYNEI